MNVPNIVGLAEQLQSLGFLNLGYSLAKRICFKPDNFTLHYSVEKEEASLRFLLHFKKDTSRNEYSLLFYDAFFQKPFSIKESISGVNVTLLEEQMVSIDWKAAFDFSERTPLSGSEKLNLEKELMIEAIIDSLTIMQTTDEGKAAAVALKLKYWSGASYQEVDGNAEPKSKSEISQRFYLMEGQSGISIEEACRFLQNRWLEKEMLARKKQGDKLSSLVADSNLTKAFPQKNQSKKVPALKSKKRI